MLTPKWKLRLFCMCLFWRIVVSKTIERYYLFFRNLPKNVNEMQLIDKFLMTIYYYTILRKKQEEVQRFNQNLRCCKLDSWMIQFYLISQNQPLLRFSHTANSPDKLCWHRWNSGFELSQESTPVFYGKYLSLMKYLRCHFCFVFHQHAFIMQNIYNYNLCSTYKKKTEMTSGYLVHRAFIHSKIWSKLVSGGCLKFNGTFFYVQLMTWGGNHNNVQNNDCNELKKNLCLFHDPYLLLHNIC